MPTTVSRRLGPVSLDALDFYNRRQPHSRLDRQTPDGVYFNRLLSLMAA